MAANRPEVDIVADGVELKDPYNNQTFIQNLYKNRGLWESREGFGTIAEINGQLNALDLSENSASQAYTYGLEECLGVYPYQTEFGHDQIISVFYARSNTGNIYNSESDKVYHYTVVIYDATTNNYWYETLYKHTAEQSEPLQVSPYYKGYYETRDYGTDFQGTKLAKPLNFFFRDYLGKVYFGNKQGIWVYNPASFIDNRYKQVNYVNNRDELNDQQSNHYAETGLITPVVFVNGLFSEANAYTYVGNDDIYDFVDIDSISGRLIYAAGKTIYFSDIGQPNAIIGENSFTFWEMTGPITAIQYLNDNIIVWSASQTFLYQPSQGVLLSGGRAIRIHDEVGCLSPNAVLFRENVVYWVDANGTYVTTNGLQLEELSGPIKRFFQYETINPLIHYFTQNGFANPSTESPDFVYRAEGNLANVHLDYDQVNEQLFVVFPQLDIAWVYKNGWYLWNFSTIVESETDPETEEVTYIVSKKVQCDKPWFASTQTKTYIVGGKKEYAMSAVYGEGGEGYQEQEVGSYTSYRIFEWKRGGAQDGSTYDYIEGRRFAGFYRKLRSVESLFEDNITTYFDPAERYGAYLNIDKEEFYYQDDDMYLLPIRIAPQQNGSFIIGVEEYVISFYIDKTRWRPVYWSGGEDNSIYFILPTERSSDYSGYSPAGPVTPTSGVTFDLASGLITIKFDAGLIPANNLSQPWINIRGKNKHDLIYIPLQKVNRDSTALGVGVKNPTTNIVTQLGLTEFICRTYPAASVTVSNGSVYDWNPGWFQFPVEQERTQGIDWLYKSAQIGIEDEAQIKARGSYSLISTTGEGEQIKPWYLGVWNSVAGSDYKDYVSQNIDFVGQPAPIRPDLVAIDNVSPVRTRFQNNFGSLSNRYFTDNLPFGAVYGNAINPSEGNYYVDTQEVDTIATSDSVRGESVSYTFFGFLQDKANKLLIRNIKIALQAVAGRRRRGR